MTIVNDGARIINKLDSSLTDEARVFIYDHHMFIVHATGHRSVGKRWLRFENSVAYYNSILACLLQQQMADAGRKQLEQVMHQLQEQLQGHILLNSFPSDSTNEIVPKK
jgi:hypothetical protein